jgi:dihydropteroate synthase
VRRPQDKPRVERAVSFVPRSFFAGGSFVDLADAQRRAEAWCLERAEMRVHGGVYDLPLYVRPKVYRDHHVEVAKAIYSAPGNLIDTTVDARAARQLRWCDRRTRPPPPRRGR